MEKKHIRLATNFVLLFIILLTGMLFFFLYKGFPGKQYIVIIVTSTLYFCWGVFHHYLEHDLHPRIVVEYLLLAILAVVLLRGALFR